MPSYKSTTGRGHRRPRRKSFHASLELMESRQLLATFTVTNTADSGTGSLRAAILSSNSTPGGNNIEFAIPASTAADLGTPVAGFNPVTQDWTITLASALPTITNQVIIDGFSQAQGGVPYRYPAQLVPTVLDPVEITSTASTASAEAGLNAVPRLIIDGSQTGGSTGFVVDASHSVIRGLVIDGFGVGVSVPDPGTVGDLIQGNNIGKYFEFFVDSNTGSPLSTGSVGFTGHGNSLQGVVVDSTNTTVGGVETQDGNVIDGNGQQGVSILAGADGNQVIGNEIGIDGPATGGSFVISANGAEGVLLASSSNSVGGPTSGAGNLISGNTGDGVHIVGASAIRNDIQGNFIGTSPGGGYLFGNGQPGNGGDGVRIEDAPDNLVGGTASSNADRNVISANGGAGVRIFGTSAVGDVLQDNEIGLTSDGVSALGNAQEGVAIYSPDNVVGPKNVISANLRGILLSGLGATSNTVQGNFVGTDSTGTADLGNAQEGIRIDGASDNVVSGNGTGSQVISGNNVGVLIIGPTATGNQVLGSFIGTDVTGTLDLGNSQEGVRIEDSPSNTVGGSTSAARDVISANHQGVVLTEASTTGNVVQGNNIGTDVSGNLALANEVDGVLIEANASSNLIGGSSAATGNMIGFNKEDGVRVQDASVGNAILSNQIFANLGLGIDLYVPTPTTPGSGPNLLQVAPSITGVAISSGSTGIQGTLNANPNTSYTIQFFANSPLDPTGAGEGGQYLGQIRTTTGPNGVATFSATFATTLLTSQVVTATATDPAGNTSEFSSTLAEVPGTVQFQMTSDFVNEAAGTATIVVARTGGSGGMFTVNYATSDGTAQAGTDYTATSGTLTFGLDVDSLTFTVPILDDGQPSANKTVDLTLSNPTGSATLGAPSTAVLTIVGNPAGSSSSPYLVTNTADSGPGSLRAAILESNAHPGGNIIDFDIPASTAANFGTPVAGFNPVTQDWTITLASPLPTITQQVTIDGFSEAQFPVPFRYPSQLGATLLSPIDITSTPNTSAALAGNNAVSRVIIDGSQTGGATGFILGASDSILRGLIVDGFGVGISVPGPGTSGDLIQGNDVGKYLTFPVDPTTGTSTGVVGLGGQGNSLQGVLIGSTNTTVGGSGAQDANVIVGNGQQGISILAGADGNQVLGNQVGIDGPTGGGRFAILPNGAEGILVASSSNSIGGPASGAGNLISGNTGDGVHVVGPSAIRNDIQGNSIGVGPGGGFLFGTSTPGNGGDGVRIENASDNLVGGSATTDRNVISANGGAGVRIFGTSGVRNQVEGNVIGLTSDGASALGNAQEGVAIYSPDNIVGPKNVISANLRGILLSGLGATGNQVIGNMIGTDMTGTAKLSNALEGIRVDGASNNLISGNGTGSQVISGNNVGVLIIGPTATGNQVLGSFIGTDVTGTLDLGNSQEGVRIEDAPGNLVGGSTAATRNVISANHWGVVLTGSVSAGNLVQGNFIGTDITGASALSNEVDGVLIEAGASGNLVGGTAASGDTIAFNREDGVRVQDASVGNAILSNQIFANLGLGIDLYVPTPTTPGSGPNLLQVAPSITAVATSSTSTTIQGTLSGTPNTTFLVQFFANSPYDPTGAGEGGQFLGQASVTTGPGGSASFSATVPIAIKAGQVITATATDPNQDTSEFSEPLAEVFATVEFQMADESINESAGTATITVVRSGGSGGTFTVNYATSNGSAQAGTDYTATSGTLTFATGVDTQTFTVPILDDGLPASDKTVVLTLSSPTGSATLGPQATSTLTIVGNNAGAFQFQMADYFVTEAGGLATITVTRSSGDTTASVNYFTGDGTAKAGLDYTGTYGTLTFNPGVLVQTFTVPILIDPAIPGNLTINLTLSSPTNGATLAPPSTAVLVIVDDFVDRMGPHVTSIRAVSGSFGVAEVVVTFDEPLDPTRAVNLLNYGYSVRTAGKDGKLGTKDDLLIGIASASYNPVTGAVTLPLGQAIAPNMKLELMINEATDVAGANVGVSDLAGNLLDGNFDGKPGGVYSAVVVAQKPPKVQPVKAPKPVHVAKPKPKPIKPAAPAKPASHQHK